MRSKGKRIWLTWERQRRSIELSEAFHADLAMLDQGIGFSERSIWQYVSLLARTVCVIVRAKPSIVFAQNPSIVLAGFLGWIRPIFGFFLVVDRHSNFKLDCLGSKKLKWLVFHALSRFSVKKANVTIVTNEFLANVVNSWGGNAFVLQDKLPVLRFVEPSTAKESFSIACVGSFSADEPVMEVIEAARLMPAGCVVYLTGDWKKYRTHDISKEETGGRVILTGYLSDEKYAELLFACDVVMVLTKHDHTLTCGAYEGIALGKPLILSDTPAIRDYFSSGVIYTGNTPRAIATSIELAMNSMVSLRQEIQALRGDLLDDWRKRFESLEGILTEIEDQPKKEDPERGLT